MPLRIKCPTGHTLIVPEDRAGRTVRCPRCEQAVVVPGIVRQPVEPPAAKPSPVNVPKRSAAPLPEPAKAIAPAGSKPKAKISSQRPKTVESARPTEPLAPPPIVEPPVLEPPPVVDFPADDPPPVVDFVPHEPAVVEPDLIEPPIIPPPVVPPEIVEAIPLEPPPPRPLVDDLYEAAAAEPPLATPVVELAPAEIQAPLAAPGPAPLSLPAPQVAPHVEDVPAPPVHAPLPGVLHERSKVLVVYQLAAALIAAALFSMAPAAWDIVDYWRIPESHFVARWALVLIFLGTLQLAYGVYVIQLPDWGTVWVVTLYSLGLATLYAMLLGVTLLSPESGAIVSFLQLGDKIAGSKASLWCVCMVSVATLLAFFAGRLSVRWHKTEQILRSVGY